MSAVLTEDNHYTAGLQEQADSLPGASLPWVQQLRQQALQQFCETGFPTLREEEWKYTNVSALLKRPFRAFAESTDLAEINAILNAYRLPDCYTVVMLNGRYIAELSDLQGLPDGVVIGSMAEILNQQGDLLADYLGKAVADEQHGFMQFNSAGFADGLFVSVPENTVLDKPVQCLHIVNQADVLANTRNIIVLKSCAEMQLIESFVGDVQAAALSVAVNEIFVAENASLQLNTLQNVPQQAYHFNGYYVQQAKHARMQHHAFSFGAALARLEVHSNLAQAAECELNGLYVGVKKQHLDQHTRIHHLEPHAISRECYKGVLDQRARGVFQGRVIVAEDAQKTDSEMNNRNLLLSEYAEADSKPQLEIYADDVKCAHGVTTGQLDEQSVFYLQSRCVDDATARNMLTFAFANEMVEKINVDAFKHLVLKQLLEHFPQTGIVKQWL